MKSIDNGDPSRSRCSCGHIAPPVVFGLIAAALAFLVAVAYVGGSAEKQPYAVPLLLLCVFPGFVILYFLYWRAHQIHVPAVFVACMFLSGILAAVPLALVESQVEKSLFPTKASVQYPNHVPRSTPHNLALCAVLAFVGVPLAEEGLKILASWWRVHASQDFMTTYGMLVLAVSFSLGFATLENAGYVLSPSSRLDQAVITALVRGALSVPMHFCCGVMIGAGLATAYRPSAPADEASDRPSLLIRCCTRGPWWLSTAVKPLLLHGLYDFLVLAPASLEPNKQSPKFTWIAFAAAALLVLAAFLHAICVTHQLAKDSAGDCPQRRLSSCCCRPDGGEGGEAITSSFGRQVSTETAQLLGVGRETCTGLRQEEAPQPWTGKPPRRSTPRMS